MVRNRIHTIVGIVLVTLLTFLPASALGQATSMSQTLAPCVDQQTFAVVRLDLARVDADAVFDASAQAASKYVTADQLATLKDKSGGPRLAMKQRIDAFKAAGGETIYLVWSTTDLPMFLMVIPATAKTNPAALKDWANGMLEDVGAPELVQIRKQNLLLFGPQEILDRWAKTAPVVLPALDKAAAAVPDATLQVLLTPNEDSRRILGAMLPTILAKTGVQADGNAIAEGFQWAAIAINAPPKPAIAMHIQASDNESAQALSRFVASIWQRVGQIPALQRTAPNLQASLALLAPAAQGNASRLALDDKQFTRLAADLFAPAAVRAKAEVARIKCGTNLSGIGKAMLIYANDYNDKWPPNLEILVKTVEMTPYGLRCGGKRNDPTAGVPYVYRGDDLIDVGSFDMILVCDPRSHEGGRNVLFGDTHVEWVTEEQFKNMIERDNRLRREKGLPEKPAP